MGIRACPQCLAAALAAAGTGARSMLQVCLFDSMSETFFLSRMSSRSGDDLSGRNGTKIGPFFAPGEPLPALFELACFGCGATTADGTVMDDGAVVSVAVLGSGIGYCDGAAGFGSRPEVFVKGCTARGSKDAKTEDCDMVMGDGMRE